MNVVIKNPRHPDHQVDPQFTGRWSPRAFAGDTISEEQLLTLLEAARWAPSGSNGQPWRFAWGLRGDTGFTAIIDALVPANRIWAERAAALVVVASVTTRIGSDGAVVANTSHAFDAGAAWASLALQTHLTGWSTHAMGGFDHAKAAESLRLPEDHTLHAVVAIGRQGDPSTLPEALRARELPSSRKPLTEVAARGHFPN